PHHLRRPGRLPEPGCARHPLLPRKERGMSIQTPPRPMDTAMESVSGRTPAPIKLPVPADPHRGPKAMLWGTAAAIIVVLHLLAVAGTNFDPTLLVDGWQGMARFVSDAFPPNLDWEEVIKP